MPQSQNFYAPLASRGVISIRGADAVPFLQGLVSNDVARTASGTAIWAALLTPQGKYLHDFFVARVDDALLLDCEAARLVDLGQRLHRYKLRASVELAVGEEWQIFSFFGSGALEALGLPGMPGAAHPTDEGLVYVDPRLAQAGARAFCRRDVAAEDRFAALGFAPASEDRYDELRLGLGLSDGSRDLVVEKSTLLESNFDELNGVDWNKGCYVGQELTARTKYRGLVKRRLVPVAVEGASPPPGARILCNGKDVGEMRSGIGGRGLAYLRLEAMDGGGELTVDGVRLTAVHPAWR